MSLVLAPGARLVVATHNPGKAREIAELFESRYEIVTAGELGLPEPEETEASFAGNALLKARAAAAAAGLPAVADDSGLCVEALDGAPGVHSARWAGPHRDFARAMELVEKRLADSDREERAAWFVCVLALAWPKGPVLVTEGRVDGTLTFPPRGVRGFGYDPIFLPEGGAETFGEIDPAAKAAISHRARAFTALKSALF